MDDVLSIRLAEIEHAARRGYSLPPEETIELVVVLRKYMAHAEEINNSATAMIEQLKGV